MDVVASDFRTERHMVAKFELKLESVLDLIAGSLICIFVQMVAGN